jgi:hypothetical protein
MNITAEQERRWRELIKERDNLLSELREISARSDKIIRTMNDDDVVALGAMGVRRIGGIEYIGTDDYSMTGSG